MTITVQQVINRALDKLGIIGAGDTPTTDDNALGLQALKGVFNGFITAGGSGELCDVVVADGVTTYDAQENTRVVHDGSVTVVLPDTLPYYYRSTDYGRSAFTQDDGLVRTPFDLAVVEVVDTTAHTTKTFIYDNRLRKWIDINTVTYTDECPLALRDENGLASVLAMHLSDEFGVQCPQLTAMAANAYRGNLAGNYSQAGSLVQRGNYD